MAYFSFIEGEKYFSEYKTSSSGDSIHSHYYTADHLRENFSRYELDVVDFERKELSPDGTTEVTESFFYVTNLG